MSMVGRSSTCLNKPVLIESGHEPSDQLGPIMCLYRCRRSQSQSEWAGFNRKTTKMAASGKHLWFESSLASTGSELDVSFKD